MISIAIDGPAGAGKSTVAKILAKKLKSLYFDTGALYRAVAYYFVLNNIRFDQKNVIEVLKKIQIDFKIEDDIQKMYLLVGDSFIDITTKIRTEIISMGASKLSAIPEVRTFLLDLQRNFATTHNVIMDGRDIGTVVLPNANIKIFLTASLNVRAERRFRELLDRGENIVFEDVLNDIKKRDYADSNRKIAPLKPSNDAIILDTTNYNLNQVVDKLANIFEEYINKNNVKFV